jgi:tetratricopeptide (TPR) repeat protein
MPMPNLMLAMCLIRTTSSPLLMALVFQTLVNQNPVRTDLEHCKNLYVRGWQQFAQGFHENAINTLHQLMIESQLLNYTYLTQAAIEAIEIINISQQAPRIDVRSAPDSAENVVKVEQIISLADDLYHFRLLQPALEIYQQALQQSVFEQDICHISMCLNGIGQICIDRRQYRQADVYCRAATCLLTNANAAAHHAHALHTLGMVYYRQHLNDRALAHFLQAMDLWQGTGDSHGEAETLTCMGRTYVRKQEYWFALASFEAAIDLLQESSHTEDVDGKLAVLLEQVAQLCEQTHHFDLAIAHYLDTYHLYQHLQVPSHAARVLQRLGQLHEKLGNFAIALHYHDQALKLASEDNPVRYLD